MKRLSRVPQIQGEAHEAIVGYCDCASTPKMRQDRQARRVSNCATPLIPSSHPICLPLLNLHATYLLELFLFFHILNCGTIRNVQFRFKNQSEYYDPDGISGLSKEKYLEFLGNFFALAHLNVKKSTRMAFINADWRDFQSTPARNEMTGNSIMIDDYLHIMKKNGWQRTHIMQAPLSSERFNAGVVSAMQKKKILGVTSRYVIISEKK